MLKMFFSFFQTPSMVWRHVNSSSETSTLHWLLYRLLCFLWWYYDTVPLWHYENHWAVHQHFIFIIYILAERTITTQKTAEKSDKCRHQWQGQCCLSVRKSNLFVVIGNLVHFAMVLAIRSGMHLSRNW